MWGVVLGYPIRTTGYQAGGAGKHVRKKTGVVFTLHRASPLTGVRPCDTRPPKATKRAGGSGAREGEVRLLAHSPALSLPAPRSRGRRRPTSSEQPPCTRHPTPLAGRRLAISPCHLVVSWTWLRGGLGLGVLGEGMATKAKGRPRMAASPAKNNTRRRSKGAFVERTHLAAEHSGRHELQSMILMRLVNNPYCTRSGT